MEKTTRIEEYVDKLTEKEKEQFKDLIEECRQREKALDSLDTKENLINAADAFFRLFDSINKFKKAMIGLSKAAYKAKMRSIPEDEWHEC